MEWVEVLKAIGEFGALAVIAAIFLILMVRQNKNQETMFIQLFNEVLDQMKVCAGGHVLTEEEDKTAIKIDNAINLLIQNAVTDLKCSRIFVVRYHNGGKDMNSVSFLKLSVTNESVNHGCKPVMSEFQNQFRSIVGYPVNEIERTGHSYVTDIESIKTSDIGTYELLKSRGVRSYYAHSLVNSTGYVIGSVVILYRRDNTIQENQEEIDKYLMHLSDKISGLLNVKTITIK